MTPVFTPDRVKVPAALWLAGTGLGHYARWLAVQTAHDQRDDATFLLPATRILTGNPNRTPSAPKWRRAALRWSFAGVPAPLAALEVAARGTSTLWHLVGAAAPAWTAHPYAETAAASVAGAAAVTLGTATWRIADRLKHREQHRLEKRVALSVTGLVGGELEPRHVRLSPAWSGGDPYVDITLPGTVRLDDGFKARLVQQAGERLGYLDAVGDWHTSGEHVRVRISPSASVPATVGWAAVRELAAGTDLDHPIIGVGTAGPVRLDFVQESPHTFASAPSGAGKSTLYKLLFAQRLRAGAGLVVLDYKASAAYDYLDQLPSNMVRTFTDPEVIGEVLLLLRAEKDWRRDNRKGNSGMFRTLDVLVEEANSLKAVLGLRWQAAGHKGPNQWQAALSELVFMGREFGIHLHYAAQRADAAVFGGGAQRTSFQLRLMAQQDEATWKMLAPGLPYQAAPRGTRGVWTLVQGAKDWAHLRVPLVSDAEALEFALEGAGEHLGDLTHGVTLPDSGEALTMSADTEELLLAGEGLVSLADHARTTGQNLGTLAQRVRRASIVPAQPSRGRHPALYRPEDLL